VTITFMWRLVPHQMCARHAHQTRTPQRRVIVRLIVCVTLDTQETTVVVAVRVWPANTRLLRVMHCAPTVPQDSIQWQLLPPQMCARHAHQTRMQQRQVIVRLIVRATRGIQEITVVLVMRVWLENTKLPAAAGRALYVQRVHIPPKSGLCRQYALIALLARIQSAPPAIAPRVVWPVRLESPQKDKMCAHSNPIVSSAFLGPTLQIQTPMPCAHCALRTHFLPCWPQQQVLLVHHAVPRKCP